MIYACYTYDIPPGVPAGTDTKGASVPRREEGARITGMMYRAMDYILNGA